MPRKKSTKRADGSYEYKATIGKDLHGKAIRKSFYSSKSLAHAKAKAQEYIIASQVSALTGQSVSGAGQHDTAFSHWAMQWLETYKHSSVTQNTYHSSYYLPVTRYLIPFFGDADLAAIQPIDVQRFFNQHRNLSLSYLKKIKMCLSAVFDCACENGIACRNPAKHIRLTSTAQKQAKRVYTDQQIATVKYCARMDFPAAYILLELGLRRGELCGLKWSDIDRKARTIRIDRSIRVTSGVLSITEPKHGSHRVLPLSDECLRYFLPFPGMARTSSPTRLESLGTQTGLPEPLPNSWIPSPLRFRACPHMNCGIPVARHCAGVVWISTPSSSTSGTATLKSPQTPMYIARWKHCDLRCLVPAISRQIHDKVHRKPL